MLNMNSLQDTFLNAIKNNLQYIGIKVSMQGFDGCEIIINPNENFQTKLDYYKRAYNNDLTLKTFNGIKIINIACGSISDIENSFREN